MDDPRSVYVPELEEERFQSIVAVPIPAREGRPLGAIVLHTEAPREFDDGIIAVLTRAAALVAGAIENAKLFEDSQLRVRALTRWTDIAQRLAGASDRAELYRLALEGARQLLPCDQARLYEFDADDRLHVVAQHPPGDALAGESVSARVVLDLLASPTLDVPRLAAVGRELGIAEAPRAAMAIPLSAGSEQRGVLLAAADEPWHAHGAELTRALGHLLALALEKADLIERLTVENVARELFEALAQGDTARAVGRADAAGVDLDRPHAVLYARSYVDDAAWESAGQTLERAVRTAVDGAICDLSGGALRCLLPATADGPEASRELLPILTQISRANQAAMGLSDSHKGATPQRARWPRRWMRRGSPKLSTTRRRRSCIETPGPIATSPICSTTKGRATISDTRSMHWPPTTPSARPTSCRPSSATWSLAGPTPPRPATSTSTSTRCASAYSEQRRSAASCSRRRTCSPCSWRSSSRAPAVPARSVGRATGADAATRRRRLACGGCPRSCLPASRNGVVPAGSDSAAHPCRCEWSFGLGASFPRIGPPDDHARA